MAIMITMGGGPSPVTAPAKARGRPENDRKKEKSPRADDDEEDHRRRPGRLQQRLAQRREVEAPGSRGTPRR